MAKQTKKDAKLESQTDELFSQLIQEQNTLIPGAAVSGEDMFSDVKMWIPTGSTTLDTIISNQAIGGWPCGRIIEVYGQEAIGKSTLAFQAMANTQKMGGIPIYFDVEQAGSRDMMKACGVDLNRLIISGLTSIEEIFQVLEKNLTTIINNKAYKDKPVFVVLDSLAQMSTDVEVESGYENNMNITLAKAKQIGKALRKIAPFLRKANACLYVVNQLRDAPGVMFGDPTTTPGGKALKFAASVRIRLLGKKPINEMDPVIETIYNQAIEEWKQECVAWKTAGRKGFKPKKPTKPKGEEVTVGYYVNARTEKNKVGPPKREAEFTIMFAHGIVEEEAWLEYMVKFNLITEIEKGVYQFNDTSIYADDFEREQWLEILSDSDVHSFVKSSITTRLIRTIKPLGSGISSEDIESEDNDVEDPAEVELLLGEGIEHEE